LNALILWQREVNHMAKPKVQAFTYPAAPEDLPAGCGFQAGLLVDVNSGWRNLRPVINASKCVKCLRCFLLCPDGVISKDKETLTIDYDYCKGCGICANECKVKAISMVAEEV
jgi:pyruvate ferredoxin oxidoreductase delta subunit